MNRILLAISTLFLLISCTSDTVRSRTTANLSVLGLQTTNIPCCFRFTVLAIDRPPAGGPSRMAAFRTMSQISTFWGPTTSRLGRSKFCDARRIRNGSQAAVYSTVHSTKGSKALISQGGQLRGPFKLGVKYVLLDFKQGNATDLDLKSDLARFGRDSGQIYLVDGDGTLVFVTLSLEEAKDSGAYRNSGLVPEIWVRTSEWGLREGRRLGALSVHTEWRSDLLGAVNPGLHGFFHRWPSRRGKPRNSRCPATRTLSMVSFYLQIERVWNSESRSMGNGNTNRLT